MLLLTCYIRHKVTDSPANLVPVISWRARQVKVENTFYFYQQMEITDCKKRAIEHVKREHEKLRKDICAHKDERQEIAGRAGIRPETLSDYTSGTHDLSKTNFYSVVFAIGKKPEDYN